MKFVVVLNLLPYYFFEQKSCCIGFAPVLYRFFTGFAPVVPVLHKNRKKYDNFLKFFLAVYQQVRRNLKK